MPKRDNTGLYVFGTIVIGSLLFMSMTPATPELLPFMSYYPYSDGPAFAQAVKDMAGRLGVSPNDLMFIMWNETSHTFRGDIQPTSGGFNPSLATGLIQFEPDSAAEVGTTTTDLSTMTPLQQLPYVEQWFKNKIAAYGRPSTTLDTYMAVFWPAAMNQPLSYTFPAWVVSANPEFFSDPLAPGTKQDILNWLYSAIPAKYNALFKNIG